VVVFLLSLGALGVGVAFGRAFPLLGILIGGWHLLATIVGFAIRFWWLTGLVGLILFAQYSYNTGGPAYVPPAQRAPGAEAPRVGARLDAAAAVQREVRSTLTFQVWEEGRVMNGRASIRNPSAFAEVEVTGVVCEARTRESRESRHSAVRARLAPGQSFEHSLLFKIPYPSAAAITSTSCFVNTNVHLP